MGTPLPAYDEQVLRDLRTWRNPPETRRGRIGDRVERGVEKVMDKIPLKMVERVLGFVLPRMRQLSWRATSQPLVMKAYRDAGAPVSSIAEIRDVPLEVVDRVAGDKRLHEAAVAGTEGAVAGFFGGWALAADVAGVTLLSMRAVQSRALAYGFDPSEEEELEFVLHVLDAASRLGPQSKHSARTGLVIVQKQLPKLGRSQMVSEAVQRLQTQLATRLGAMKSESVAPVLGAFTSGGFNAWYLASVTETARMAYRERFLRRKYGDEVLEAYGL